MDIKQIALILLLMRLASVFLMVRAIVKQRRLNRAPVRHGLEDFRNNLNRLTLTILVANIVPILIDIVTLISPSWLHREDSPSTWSVAYALSNAFTSILQAIFVWTIYQQAESVVVLDNEQSK